MRFIARHISFQEIDGVRIFALGDKAGLPNEEQPEAFVILQFGDEADQDRALGLTGLHIETSAREPHGYGKVEHVAYDGRNVSILGRNGVAPIEVDIMTEMMTPEAISAAVDECNRANKARPEAKP